MNKLNSKVFVYLIFVFVFESIFRDYLFFLSPSTLYLIRDLFSGVCVFVVLMIISQGMLPPISKQNAFFYSFVVLQCIVMPFYSAIMAFINYGQPILFGVLAERERLLSFSALILYSLLQRNRYSLEDFSKMFIKIAWWSMIIYIGIRLLYEINPGLFSLNDDIANKGLGIIDTRTIETKGGVIMRIALAIPVYAIIYYFITYIQTKRIAPIVKMLFFLSLIIILNKGRGVVFFILLSLLVYYFTNSKLSNKLILITAVAFIVLLFVVGNIGISDDSTTPSFLSSYANIIETLKNTKTSDEFNGLEASTWARLFSFGYVSDKFSESSLNWIFGLGRISYQYNGGSENIISKYFFPEDIGIVGATFLYGSVIVLIFKTLYLKIYQNFSEKSRIQDPHLQAIKYFVVYVFISSLQTGSDMMGNPEIIFCFWGFSIVYASQKTFNFSHNNEHFKSSAQIADNTYG